MRDHYSEAQAVEAVESLNLALLRSFVEAEIITPTRTDGGLFFARTDVVRLQLLCELREDFDLHMDALGIVISLIDQLHAARSDLRHLLKAINAEPQDVVARIQAHVVKLRAGP